MKTFHELCGSRFYKEIGKKIVRERKDEIRRRIFEARCEGATKGAFWVMKKKLSG
jgi:hypothetical protein